MWNKLAIRRYPMVTLYHNPRCSKSRQALALLEEKGVSPDIVLYLETPPNKTTLKALLKKLGKSPRELLRKSEDAYKDNNLADPKLSDDDIINAMIKFPKLIERPIAVNGDKAALGRPPENVLSIL